MPWTMTRYAAMVMFSGRRQGRDSPFDDLIRMKDWDLFRDLSEEEALAPNLVERVVEGFRIGKPVNDFFNRVLDDTKIKSIF